MPRLFRLLILLSLVLLSSCLNKQESARTPPTLVEALVATAEPGDLLEEKIMSSLANADVIFVRAEKDPEPDSWTFQVTVQHPDTGWDDYADGWDVVLPDGTVVKPDPDSPFTRQLLHPHQEEQPFTRSQSGILIPAEVTIVHVRAHDLVDGFGGEEIIVDLTRESGPAFEVIR
jgi:hypothetical protein